MDTLARILDGALPVVILAVAVILVLLHGVLILKRVKHGGSTDIKWNLLAFGGLLFATLVVIVGFAAHLMTPSVIKGNEELVIGALIAIVSVTVGCVGGYALGVMHALSASPDPAPKMTEAAAIELARIASDRGAP